MEHLRAASWRRFRTGNGTNYRVTPNVDGKYLDFERLLAGQRVLVTGHTGFTGGWLTLWLRAIGCETFGLALPPETQPNLFSAARISDRCHSRFGDIRDLDVVTRAVSDAQPCVIFHLAAQPLVSRGFIQPVETFAANVLGTAHILEAARLTAGVRAVVCVTTDKVYADREWLWGYREADRLGGKDPYAASKACAELVAACYRATMAARGNGCMIATARGGNIIGGGDWSENRIVPDFVQAVTSSGVLTLRNPDAVRPWQHVLGLVHAYLLLAGGLVERRGEFADSWNFGPLESEATAVGDVVEHLGKAWRMPQIALEKPSFPETRFLQLDSSKARALLGWRPMLDFANSVCATAEWYRDYYADPSQALALTNNQISQYREKLGLGA
jgi:CDP-glucose 4,6-dehydratase